MSDHTTMRGDTSWFVRDRFGLFIHWGLYAMPARHEWMRHNEKTPTADYDARYFTRFEPDLHDPAAWAQAAADAGMKYVVITAKHHEGFCLWDSKHTDYTAMNTPAKRDLIRPLLEAFRAKGLRVGLYYSLLDWHHPHCVIDPHIGPYRDHADRATMNEGRDQRIYAKYMRDQVTELLTGYGKIDIMWFDFSYPKPDGTGKGKDDWESDALLKVVRSLQPHIILDERLDLPYGWDIKTPEQYQPRRGVTVDGKPVVWEACQTFSGSWGYHRDETTWKSHEQLIHMLIDTVSKGGNLLMNVGPTARGEFDARALDRLAAYGRWMHHHQHTIYGCEAAPADIPTPEGCRLTWNPAKKRLYVHCLVWPFKYLWLEGLESRVEYAQFVHDGSEIRLQAQDWTASHAKEQAGLKDLLMLELPTPKPDAVVPVIELFLK